MANNLNIGTTTTYARLNIETDGSAASPGTYPTAPLGYFLSWAGDGPTTDTGIPLFAIAAGRIWTTDTYAANARLFQVSTDNGVQFIIRGNGSVGIGTTSPSQKLEVNGKINAGLGSGYHVQLDVNAIDAYNSSSASALYVQANTGGNTILNPNGGNVGIGTASPFSLLNIRTPSSGNLFTLQADGTTVDYYSQMRFIAGSRNAYIWLRNQNVSGGEGDGALSIYTDVGHISFWTAATRRMIITAGGNVGIGTTNPSEKLQVYGSANLISLSDVLPGYSAGQYTCLKSTGPYLYVSVNGAYSAYMNSAGAWTGLSDRAKKENFVAVDPQQILAKIDSMPMYQWNFKDESPSVKHIAPVAQDFYAAFGLNGDDDKMISNIDPSGVALVGVKALSSQLKAQQRQIDELKAQIKRINERLQ